jgi:hypothetical protein
MTTLREAAQQALEALKDCVKALDALHAPGDSIYTRASDSADRAEIALRDALAQQEQEPVAWMVYTEDGKSAYVTDNPHDLVGAYKAFALYTAPPHREWHPLTDKEIRRMGIETPGQQGGWNLAFARAVERALKEKNHV